MKKTVFILLLSLGMAQNMEAQCESYIQRIDSLVKATKENSSQDLWSWFGKQRGKYTPPPECERTLLNYTNGKGYYGDSTRTMIQSMLSELAEYAENKAVREDAVNAYFDRCYPFRIRIYYTWKAEDYNLQAREHLKRFLRRQYTQEETERYVREANKYKYMFHPLDTVAKYIALENKLDFRQVKDSILKADYEEPRKRLSKEGYNINIPLLTGWHNMKEMIPLLDSIRRADDDLVCAMALARMGDKECREYFEKGNRVYLTTAFYIGTQEMIAKFGEELYSTEERWYLSGDTPDDGPIPVACNTIIDLQNNISNFPKLTERSIYFGQPRDLKELPPDALEKARQWMKENKGNYQISERFRPLFGVDMFKSYY